MTKTYTVTHPSGEVSTRKSVLTPTHAVVTYRPRKEALYSAECSLKCLVRLGEAVSVIRAAERRVASLTAFGYPLTYSVKSWHGSHAAAVKASGRFGLVSEVS